MQKIILWLTEHDNVINITPLPPTKGRHYLLVPGAADCAPTPLILIYLAIAANEVFFVIVTVTLGKFPL